MPQALAHTDKIAQDSGMSVEFRTLTSSFGNGYEQRSADGLNSKKDIWNILYKNLTAAEKTTVVAVFDAVRGWDHVTWTPYGEGSSKKFKLANGYRMKPHSGSLWNVSVELTQVFDVV